MPNIYPFSSTHSEPLISPRELKQRLPATIAQTHFIEQSRQQIVRILEGSDPRYLLIMGPCSIHDPHAAREYAAKIQELQKDVADVFLIVMRTYFEKPRTSTGWKGMLYDPHLNGSHDMDTGLQWTRELLISLAERKIPAAAEILDPISAHYFGDLLSWGCIGARTASSQLHRQAASGLPMPVAFKNNTDGNVEVAIRGVLTAQNPHAYIGINEVGCASLIHTRGNPHGHIVLRGGEQGSNYDPDSIAEALGLLQAAKLPLRLIVDCSHDNSRSNHLHQPAVFHAVIDQILARNRHLRGFILESNLEAGNQPMDLNPSTLKFALSITDPCLGWDATAALITEARGRLLQQTHPTPQERDQEKLLV